MKPTLPLTSVSEYLRTAGVHLVLDTAVARRKPGVLAEALWKARYGSPRERVLVRMKRGDVVEVYGAKERCPRTRRVLAIARDAGARIVYHDIDQDPAAREVVLNNRSRLEGGELLPLVRLNGGIIFAQDIESFDVRGDEKDSAIINPDCSAVR